MGSRRIFSVRLSTIALISGAHLLLALVCLVVGMGDWGDQPTEPTAVQEFAWGAATVLFAPGRWLWTGWASKNLPDIVEWALFIANSLLWGTALAALWNRWRSRRRTRSAGTASST